MATDLRLARRWRNTEIVYLLSAASRGDISSFDLTNTVGVGG